MREDSNAGHMNKILSYVLARTGARCFGACFFNGKIEEGGGRREGGLQEPVSQKYGFHAYDCLLE